MLLSPKKLYYGMYSKIVIILEESLSIVKYISIFEFKHRGDLFCVFYL